MLRGPLLRLIKAGSGVPSRWASSNRTNLGIKVKKEKKATYDVRQEFRDPETLRLIKEAPIAERVFSTEFGDVSDRFNRELGSLFERMTLENPSERVKKFAPTDRKHLPRDCDPLVKTVAVSHVRMKYLAAKMEFDPSKLRGPQIKYHPHMEVRVLDRMYKNRRGREEVLWNKANYVRQKQAEFAKTLGNRYDSYYVWKRQIAQNRRLVHSRNGTFFRWVYYHQDTGQPYELHGKAAAQMHRWTELKEERDGALREIELNDIVSYKHVIDALQIPAPFIPTFRVPQPKWFRGNSISPLSEQQIEDLRLRKRYDKVSAAERDNAKIPARPTKFNELIAGWERTDLNKRVDSDFSYGLPVVTRDPVPLA